MEANPVFLTPVKKKNNITLNCTTSKSANPTQALVFSNDSVYLICGRKRQDWENKYVRWAKAIDTFIFRKKKRNTKSDTINLLKA